jgi:tryptophan-rich sensory protein
MTLPRNAGEWIALVVFVLGSLAAGFVGSIATTPNIPTWYATLVPPPLNPPNWIFGPVWTALYILMGIAGFLVWQRRDHPAAKLGLILFVVQLALNTLWSWLYFGVQSLGLAFICISALWLAILGTIERFYRVRPLAAYLLIPYIAWVTFASYLNAAYWYLNPAWR